MKVKILLLVITVIVIISCSNDDTGSNYSVGDRVEGGIVFYVDGSKALVASISDQSTGTSFGGAGTNINGANSSAAPELTDLFSGKANTEAIVNALGAGTYAAKICYDLVLNGYNDWYLPSEKELIEMYKKKDLIGGFANQNYHSSTEVNSDHVFQILFSNGDQAYDTLKGANVCYVRAIRSIE